MALGIDGFYGGATAPTVEVNPIDQTVDLVWEDGPVRLVVSLAAIEELRLLMQRAIEAVQGEQARSADVPAGT